MTEVNASDRLFLVAGYGIAALGVALSIHNPFFWDTVQLGSIHATFFYDHGFLQLLPDDFDSGHIPAFGVYIALVWECFGRNLVSSHLAMLPFTIGIVYQLHRACRIFVPSRYAGTAALLLVIDPTLLAQMTLVSPDVPLVFFFLMGFNAIFSGRRGLLALAAVLLVLTSMRGMMVTSCLFILDFYLAFQRNERPALGVAGKKMVAYLPAAVTVLAYGVWHYAGKGWVGFHENSPWAKSFESVGFGGLLYNIGTLGWRMLDFGRVGIWLVFLILLVKHKKQVFDGQRRTLGLFFLLLVVILPANMLWAKGLMGHRYLLPLYLMFSLLCASVLFAEPVAKRAKVILGFTWAIVLLTGNLWIYPHGISQGWDASLAHRPYFDLRRQANQYFKDHGIDYRDVKSFFPNTASFDLIDLDGNDKSFDTNKKDYKYVMYSNVYNQDDAVPDDIIKECDTAFHIGNRIFVTIYRKRP
jgi:hypothetical protein